LHLPLVVYKIPLLRGKIKTMSKQNDEILIKRTLVARFVHACIFEITAIILTAFYFVVIMQQSSFNMALLSIAISLVATLWNGVFNFFFDRLQKRFEFSRTLFIRIAHAFAFEGGLVFLTIPMVSYSLQVDFLTAFMLEAALLVLFLPYSFFFNFIYDKIYIWLYQK